MLTHSPPPLVRKATPDDADAVRKIYNEGIADRIATLEVDAKSADDMAAWWKDHSDRYAVVVADDESGNVVGWASLNPYSHRCAYRGVADLSVYVTRERRGTGIGSALLVALERIAKANDFHKIVLFALASNDAGRRLYLRRGYSEVGVFHEQGRLDGKFVDIVAMEKILKPFVLFVCKHNTGRSQMAEAFLRQTTGEAVEVASAGTIAADRPDPGVVAMMAEVDIDISCARPKLLDATVAARADRIITMGCDVEGLPRIDDDWGLPDPKVNHPSECAKFATSFRSRPSNSRAPCSPTDSRAAHFDPAHRHRPSAGFAEAARSLGVAVGSTSRRRDRRSDSRSASPQGERSGGRFVTNTRSR